MSIATKCNCAVCSYYERVKSAIDALPTEHQEFFNIMYDDYVHLQSKYNHQRAVIDGSWPNADQIIKHKRMKREQDLRSRG